MTHSHTGTHGLDVHYTPGEGGGVHGVVCCGEGGALNTSLLAHNLLFRVSSNLQTKKCVENGVHQKLPLEKCLESVNITFFLFYGPKYILKSFEGNLPTASPERNTTHLEIIK